MPRISDTNGDQKRNIRGNTQRSRDQKEEKAKQLLMTKQRMEGLKDSLKLLDVFVNNRHMDMLQPATFGDLYKSEVCVLENSKKNRLKNIAIYHVTKIMYNQDEDNFEKLVSVYSAIYTLGGIVGMILQSDGKYISFYVCVNNENNEAVAGNLLSSNFRGQFPGCELSKLDYDEKEDLLDSFSVDLMRKPNTTVKSISMIPGRREEEQQQARIFTSQGFEKFIDTMNGKKYTLVVLAQKVSGEAMDLAKSGFEDIYTSLSPYAKEQASYAESETDSINYTISNGISHSTGQSISNSYGTNHNHSIAKGKGKNSGTSSSWLGLGFSNGSSWSSTTADSSGTSQNRSTGSSYTEGDTSSESESMGRTTGVTRTVSVTRDNKAVVDMLEKLDAMIQRIESNQLFGMWNASSYIISEDSSTASIGVSTLLSLLSGDNKVSSQAYINEWDKNKDNGIRERDKVLDYLGNLYHPEISLEMYKLDEIGNMVPMVNEDGKNIPPQVLTPGIMVSGREIPIMLGLPNRSVPGVVVDSIAEFGRNIPETWRKKVKNPIPFGNVFHMGAIENTSTILDLNAFSSHTFICGASGSGKSNTTYNLLYEMIKRKIPFLVVEPAKGEYKIEFAALKGVNIFVADDNAYRKLQINPFEFNPRIHIREHLDRLSSTVCACWPLYGAMPGLLKQAFEKVYIDHGWDLEYSKRIIDKGSKYPTFKDLEKALNQIIDESPYSKQSKGDYKGALLNRVSSLNNGFEGQIFGSSIGVSDKTLFDGNTIIDLSSIGSEETKSLIMGILIIRLQEYRKATRKNPNSSLQHITVLEEAHNILKRCSQDTNVESGNVQGQSVKMLCGCIAEMRSFGEGFMIIDQSPSAVDETAIKNTAIKIVMRLPNKDDCEAMGAALSLDEEQTKELSRLDVGVAAIYHVGWTNTLLARMGQIWDRKVLGTAITIPFERNNYMRVKGAVVQFIYNRICEKDYMDLKNDTIDLIDELTSKGQMNVLPNDKIQEIILDVSVFFENNKNLISASNHPRIKGEYRDFMFDFLRLSSVFKIVELKGIKDHPKFGEKPTQKETNAALKWGKELKQVIGQYLIMPADVDPISNHTWPPQPYQAELFNDIFHDLILSYAQSYWINKDSDKYYTALDILQKKKFFK
ncbi:MAG: DUF87 domain-containing protein [Erysipelotrichaceae bacterium]|nr:DUF87 domain-containing protein [Erysipelotrichaceae bacterium]